MRLAAIDQAFDDAVYGVVLVTHAIAVTGALIILSPFWVVGRIARWLKP